MKGQKRVGQTGDKCQKQPSVRRGNKGNWRTEGLYSFSRSSCHQPPGHCCVRAGSWEATSQISSQLWTSCWELEINHCGRFIIWQELQIRAFWFFLPGQSQLLPFTGTCCFIVLHFIALHVEGKAVPRVRRWWLASLWSRTGPTISSRFACTLSQAPTDRFYMGMWGWICQIF